MEADTGHSIARYRRIILVDGRDFAKLFDAKLIEKNIIAYFGESTARKGQFYFANGHVKDCIIKNESANSRCITGGVQGTRSRPYDTEVLFDLKKQEVLYSECSCPVDMDCKHGAALTYEYLNLQRAQLESNNKTQLSDISTNNNAPNSIVVEDSNWLESITNLVIETNCKTVKECLIYVLTVLPPNLSASRHQIGITLAVGRKIQTGHLKIVRPGYDFVTILRGTAAYIAQEDKNISRFFVDSKSEQIAGINAFPEEPELANFLLHRIISTGRCIWMGHNESMPLSFFPPKPGSVYWRENDDGTQRLMVSLRSDPAIQTFYLSRWIYYDKRAQAIGLVDLPLSNDLLKGFVNKKLSPEDATAIYLELSKSRRRVALPAPKAHITTDIIHKPPVPVLNLSTISRSDLGFFGTRNFSYSNEITVAALSFDYDGIIFSDKANEHRQIIGDKLKIIRRHKTSESQFLAELNSKSNLVMAPFASSFSASKKSIPFIYQSEDPKEDLGSKWLSFSHQILPMLKATGWRINFDPSFKYVIVDADEEWESDVTSGNSWWFSLKLGITVDGKQMSLLPILSTLLASMRSSERQDIDKLNHNGHFYAPLSDGRILALPFERVAAVLQILIELFDHRMIDKNGSIKISIPQVSALMNSNALSNLRWLGNDELREKAAQLKEYQGLKMIEEPKQFKGTLRDYQKEGLSWLQFLAKYQMGGILADDMGLGKTAQTIAHILKEKIEKRLLSPALIICPTSIVHNWQSETERFAPQLKTLCLHGSQRFSSFKNISKADMVLSTYPLLLKDYDKFAEVNWHLIVLDEAQAIKNPDSQVSVLSSTLKANHRICLTGTPIQNHLGDLWSQFNFLMPGLLGEKSNFKTLFRNPIESNRDYARQQLLSSRLRPFILRRTKEEVAKELPPKTIMLRYVQLEGDQRDLYETVRLAMHEKVKEALR
jgi:hypothetical protein